MVTAGWLVEGALVGVAPGVGWWGPVVPGGAGRVAVGAVMLGVALLLWPARRQRVRARGVAGGASTGPRAGAAWSHRPQWMVTGWFSTRRRLAGVRPTLVWTVMVGMVAVPSMVAGPACGLAAAIAAATGHRLIRSAADRRRARRELSELSAGLRLLARDLRAGTSAAAAIRFAASTASGAAARVLAELAGAPGLDGSMPDGARIGDRPGSLAARLTVGKLAPSASEPAVIRRRRSRDLPPTSAALEVGDRLRSGWALSRRFGVPWAAVVQALARDLQDRADAADARTAEVAGPATSGYVLAALPAAGLLLGAGMGADPLQVLTGTPLGGVLLVVGTGLTCLGLLWSSRIVRP